ncbi:heavy metal-responsive transcriptional regulator [Sphingorhabdus lacus]|uniref:Heavy metal-responsive transcriptional regulator n=1 Tax=Sphingorhabdus lacus TaxID=392610 RepID=A0A6I6L8D2_9SPHN|nr:heavy metal-responsive transcriptional regulator [Sphingorhabdus lacus]QGY80236.1 heavy metal-responsive transcriptional regulator [Sphingorhabdus lacus]
MRGYTIGALAAACSVRRDTIRYYERSGLMPRADRTSSGYRIYGDRDVERVNFIKTAQTLGFTLSEIGVLLSIRGQASASAADVVKLTEEKIRDLSAKLRQLRGIKHALEQLVADCPIDVPVSDCPIILYMSHPTHRHRHKIQSETMPKAADP